MKKTYLFISFSLIILCQSCLEKSSNDLLTVNLNKEYPRLELNLQDIADVEYIKLATDTDFLVKSRTLVFSENYILTKGGGNGEILLFNRQGNPLTKFSHYGNGPHEYIYITNLRLDEKRKEIYVHDVLLQKMLVYNLEGDFIREFFSGDGRYIYNLDDDTFLFYNAETNKVDPTLVPYFSIVSKDEGSIVKKINLSFASEEKSDLSVAQSVDGVRFIRSIMHLPIIRYSDGYMLNELSSDTIYKYSFDGVLSPFIIRSPSVMSMSNPVYLQAGVETEKYIFMNCVSVNENNKKDMFPSTALVYDKGNMSIHKYKIKNEDYPNSEIILDSHLVNCDIQPGYGLRRFHAGRLVEAYEKGELHGRLKEIAATLEEEDNDVLMLFKFK